MNKTGTQVAATFAVQTGLPVLTPAANAGSLEPAAPPAPTMKTLSEVEPRVPLHASDVPLTITEPNSSYQPERMR